MGERGEREPKVLSPQEQEIAGLYYGVDAIIGKDRKIVSVFIKKHPDREDSKDIEIALRRVGNDKVMVMVIPSDLTRVVAYSISAEGNYLKWVGDRPSQDSPLHMSHLPMRTPTDLDLGTIKNVLIPRGEGIVSVNGKTTNASHSGLVISAINSSNARKPHGR